MYIYVYMCIKCAYKQINEIHLYLYVYMHMHMYAYAYVHVDIYMYLFHTCVYTHDCERSGFYGEALKHDEKHADSMISLAKLHMDREELAEVDCNTHCNTLQHVYCITVQHNEFHLTNCTWIARNWRRLSATHTATLCSTMQHED